MSLSALLATGNPLIMGVLNVTPDSFSDGGQFLDVQKGIAHAEQMMADGADFIDVGAESSAPNSVAVSLEEEWHRLEKILPFLAVKNIPFSVDTWKSEIARRSLELGAEMINDVTGLRGDPEMGKVLATFAEAYICIMYSKDNTARTTLEKPEDEDIIGTISAFFTERLEYAAQQGIDSSRIILDPGMGAFLSSDPEQSFTVLRRLSELQVFQRPLLIGTSRKGFLKTVSAGKNASDRVIASVISSLLAIQNGARIVRVHDVREMREAVKILEKFEYKKKCS